MASPPAPTSPQVPDMGALKEWLERAIASRSFSVLVQAILALVLRMRDLNLELCRRLANMQRKRPKSERLSPLKGQLALAFGTVLVEVATPPTPPPGVREKRCRKGRHPGRSRAPAHLPRVPVPNLVPPEKRICPVCGCEMKTLGFTSCEHIDVVPARIVVVERLDETVACEHDESIASAAPPPQLIPRGKLGLTLIIEALADKYLEHLPIERQCLRFERAGVSIAPQTLGRSVAAAIDALTPIADLILGHTRGPGNLSTDATGIPVLDRDAPGGIRLGTMWVWTNARWVSFVYAPTGNSDSVRGFLGDDLARTVQCDGTSLTTFLERVGGKRPGCWSHGRRGLVEAARGGDLLALEGLELIAPLFRIERDAALAGDSAKARQARRAEHSAPVLAAIRGWVDQHSTLIPLKTPLGKALGYLRRQWRRLVLFVEDGSLEITNNRCERELRKLVLGRKNWLFTWEDLGAARTARILSIVATCVTHAINPRAYFHVVTQLLVNGWPPERLAELLPNRIAKLHPELARPTPDALLEACAPPQLPALPGSRCGDADARGASCLPVGMRLPLEGTLLEKLRKIEALHAGTAVEGEREAARRAAERIRARLADLRDRAEDVELLYRLPDPWKRRLFVALCRRYGLKPFREAGRRYTTVQVRAPKAFHDKTLWPEYLALAASWRPTSTSSRRA